MRQTVKAAKGRCSILEARYVYSYPFNRTVTRPCREIKRAGVIVL